MKFKNPWCFFLLFFFCNVALAIPVEDFATEYSTMMSYFKNIEEAIDQGMMLQNQLKQLTDEAKNLAKFNDQQWDNANGALSQLSYSIQKGQALAYSMADIDNAFKQRFPGYSASATTDYSKDYMSWVKTNQDTMRGVLAQVNESFTQQQTESAMIQTLANRAKSPLGRMQALQVANEIAAEQVAQLQKLKATMLAQTNAQAEYYAYQSQKDAAQQQSVDAVIKNASDTFPAYHNDARFGQMPAFDDGG